MVLKAIKHLPMGAKKMFDAIYNKSVEMGKSELLSNQIAWDLVKNNYSPMPVARTAVMRPSYDNLQQSHILKDVVMGFEQVGKRGSKLVESFWQNIPSTTVTGDMEHIHLREAEGEYVDAPEEWSDWIPVADNFRFTDGKLVADIELPKNHPFTPKFLDNKEKYGVSVEYAFHESAEEYQWEGDKLIPTITAGTITGWSFTDEPDFDTKLN